jgi:phospholipid/cholesterol/gamma-HCH transport system ATP-binding protein
MPPVVEIRDIRKNYQALRPLRVRSLIVQRGERIALQGFDAGAAEVLVNLVTGASVPDEGEVAVLGASTAAITDGDAWLQSLDRFGIVSPRAVLLDAVTLLQNLAMPFSLDIEPMSPGLAERARALGREAGIADEMMEHPIAGLTPAVRMRAHLARAVALDPDVLILEHPTATLDPGDRKAFGADVRRLVTGRGLTALIISEDEQFISAAADRRLRLNAVTGELKPRRRFFEF